MHFYSTATQLDPRSISKIDLLEQPVKVSVTLWIRAQVWPSGILGYLPNSFHQQLIDSRDAVNLTPDPLRYSHWHLVPLKPDVFAGDQGSRAMHLRVVLNIAFGRKD